MSSQDDVAFKNKKKKLGLVLILQEPCHISAIKMTNVEEITPDVKEVLFPSFCLSYPMPL